MFFQSTVAWKVVGSLFMGNRKVPSPKKNVPPGTLFSVSPGSNLSLSSATKFEGDSRKKLNEFAQVLRYFQVVDLSGEFI